MTLGITVAAVAVLLLTLAAFFYVRRRPRLAGVDWYRRAGMAFAADEEVRRAHFATARGEADGLARSLAGRVETLRDRAALGSAGDISVDIAASVEAVFHDLFVGLDARERSLGELTVVLYGRTKAGKSSLYFALSGEGYAGIGDGRQNFTRDLHRITLDDVELVDSPGVSGVGSAPLETVTEEVVRQADVLIAQVTDDAVFAEDFERLKSLGASRRPTLIALNVKSGDLDRLLAAPEKVFRARRLEPHIARLRAGLPSSLVEAPIVQYHAYAAATARRAARRQASPGLWEMSRIHDLIGAITAASDDAVAFGRLASDELICRACEQIGQAFDSGLADSAARQAGCSSSIDQIEGILTEVESRKLSMAERLDAHFATAEEELLDALSSATSEEFQERSRQALRMESVQSLILEALEDAAEDLTAKYDEFRADIALASRLTGAVDGLESLHADELADRERAREYGSRVRRRKVLRIGAKLVAGVVSALAVESGPGAVAVAIALERVIETSLPDLELPTDSGSDRQQRVGVVIRAARSRAGDAFATALTAQIIAPARVQLVSPLQEQLRDLGALDAVLDAGQTTVEAFGSRAAARMVAAPPAQDNPSNLEEVPSR